MRPKPLPPDTRLDWRDPNMPVIREYKFANGEVKTQIDPNYEQRYRDMMVRSSTHDHWRSNPTYNLRKK